MRVSVLLLAFVTAAGCGDDSNGSNPDAGPDASGDAAADANDDAFVPPANSFSVQWGPTTVQPGVESTECVIKRVGNDETIYVHQLHNQLSASSHHFIVYRVDDTTERPDPFPCAPFEGTLGASSSAPIMITQKKDDLLTLPQGIAYTFEPGQMVRMEMHYINVSASAAEASATSTFVTIPEEELEHEADIVFFGDLGISIPAMSTATLGPSFINPPAILDGANYFAITGHEHQWGTDVRVNVATGPADPGTPVYAVPQFLWDEPATVDHDPPFTVPNGGGFQLTCEWNNRSDKSVGFGTSVDDEMCFFWAYYYPSAGPVICAGFC